MIFLGFCVFVRCECSERIVGTKVIAYVNAPLGFLGQYCYCFVCIYNMYVGEIAHTSRVFLL